MKYFLVDVIYKVPAEELEHIVASHREHLQKGYDAGFLLLSGPKIPKTGGLIIAKAKTLEELKEFFSNDPYNKNNVATYQYTEFDPKLRQEFLVQWIES